MKLKPAFPLGEPVTSQGRWGPLAVDELIQAFPLGKGDRLRWMRVALGEIYPHPGLPSVSLRAQVADPPPREGYGTFIHRERSINRQRLAQVSGEVGVVAAGDGHVVR